MHDSVLMFVSINYRVTDTSNDLFNESNYITLDSWGRPFWFCTCNVTENNNFAARNQIDKTKVDCDPNPTIHKVCFDDSKNKKEVCHLARRKRSTDRHKTIMTRKQPNMVRFVFHLRIMRTPLTL